MHLSPLMITLVCLGLAVLGIIALGLAYIRSQKLLATTQQHLQARIDSRTAKLSRENVSLVEQVAQQQETGLLLETTRNYYASILNSLPAMIIGINSQGLISLWNSGATTATGFTDTEAEGLPLLTLLPGLAEFENPIEQAIKQETAWLTEATVMQLGQQKRYVDLSIHPLPQTQGDAVILISDVTQRVEAEHFLIQNEKLLSLGEMAAGLAHEINNPLSAILNNLQNLQRRTNTELEQNQQAAHASGVDLNKLQDYFAARDIKRFFVGAREAAERAAAIVSNILAFSHGGDRAQGPEPINQLIMDVVKLETRAREAIGGAQSLEDGKQPFTHQVSFDLRAKRDICECSPPEIQQVILNLIRNALQACESAGLSAQVTITSRNEANLLVLEVKDNGPGIAPENLTQIFDPFYTTKRVGEGTGLGLSVSYMIITEHHNGSIEVESELGVGTSFTIKLPLI